VPHVGVEAVLAQQLGVGAALGDPPWSSTTIWSASTTVDRRWAMTIEVRRAATPCSVSWIAASVRLSSALVASSRIRIGGSLSRVRAMATRCFSPPVAWDRARRPVDS
jgi:hypothetical protein